MTRWDLSQEHKIGSKSLDEIQLGNRTKLENHKDISRDAEKRYLKNPMNIHDKILKKILKK